MGSHLPTAGQEIAATTPPVRLVDAICVMRPAIGEWQFYDSYRSGWRCTDCRSNVATAHACGAWLAKLTGSKLSCMSRFLGLMFALAAVVALSSAVVESSAQTAVRSDTAQEDQVGPASISSIGGSLTRLG